MFLFEHRLEFEVLNAEKDDSSKVEQGILKGNGFFVAKLKLPSKNDKIQQFQYSIERTIHGDVDTKYPWNIYYGVTKGISQYRFSLVHTPRTARTTSTVIHHIDFKQQSMAVFGLNSENIDQTKHLPVNQEYCYIGIDYTNMPKTMHARVNFLR